MTDILNVFQQADFPIGILIFSRDTEEGDWRCLKANKCAESFLAQVGLISKKWVDIFPNPDINLMSKNDIFQVDHSTWLSVNVVEDKDKNLQILTLSDVSKYQQKVMDDEKTIEKLKNSNKDLEHFAYVASHDLKEPLRKIIAFSERLNKKYAHLLEGNGLIYLNRMIDATQRMQAFIDDLLMFSRFSRDSSEKTSVNLNDILRGVLSDFEIPIKSSKAKIDIQTLPTISGVKTQMIQLFQNLLSNALKFRKPDNPPHILIEFEETTTHNLITIRDNGIGFEAIDAENIFALFKRLNGRSQYEGTGIGLAVCKKIVENHGGTISARGVPNVEASFTISLPKIV